MPIVKTLFSLGPLLFGHAFLAPLTAQVIERMGWHAPLGLSPLQFGFLLGGVLGLIATWRGRWV